MTEKRYPLAALVDAVGMSEAATARMIGLSGSTLKWARVKGLVEEAADRYACRAGLVPWVVWPDWLDDLEQECADEKCTNRFVPSRKGNIFCSKECNHRAASRNHKRRRYQDPEYRARKQAANAAYKATADRAVKLKQAAYRAANAERIAAKHAEYRAANADRIRERSAAYYQANRERALARQREYDRTVRAERRRAAKAAA